MLSNLTADVTYKDPSGLINPLLRSSFKYLGGLVPSAQEDLRRHKGLAFQADTLPDSQGSPL